MSANGMMDRRRATVNDVAADANVSQATVSQVLTGKRPVSPDTRQRVLASIEKLGYRPNELARALVSQKSQTVAMVVPNMMHESHPISARGVSEILRPAGYQLALYDSDDLPGVQSDVVHKLISRMTDGAVFFGTSISDAEAALLEDHNIPYVNSTPRATGLWDAVTTDPTDAIRRLTSLVIDRNYWPIAFFDGPPHAGTARRDGFLSAIRDAGRDEDPRLIRSSEFSWAGGSASFSHLVADGLRPRAVICANDLIAIGAIKAARGAGYSIPEDLVVTGYDDIEAASLTSPTLTTIQAHPLEQGRTAGRLLLDRMSGAYGGLPRTSVTHGSIVFRESLPAQQSHVG